MLSTSQGAKKLHQEEAPQGQCIDLLNEPCHGFLYCLQQSQGDLHLSGSRYLPGGKRASLGMRQNPGRNVFKSWFCHWWLHRPWGSHSTSLSLSFFSYKMGTMMLTWKDVMRITCKELALVLAVLNSLGLWRQLCLQLQPSTLLSTEPVNNFCLSPSELSFCPLQLK